MVGRPSLYMDAAASAAGLRSQARAIPQPCWLPRCWSDGHEARKLASRPFSPRPFAARFARACVLASRVRDALDPYGCGYGSGLHGQESIGAERVSVWHV